MKKVGCSLWMVFVLSSASGAVRANDAVVRLGEPKKIVLAELQKKGAVRDDGKTIAFIPHDSSQSEITVGFVNGRCHYIQVKPDSSGVLDVEAAERLLKSYAGEVRLKREGASRWAKNFGFAWVDDAGRWRAFLNDLKSGDGGIVGSTVRSQESVGVTLFSNDWFRSIRTAK